jgi:hypothetical protein
MCGCTNHLSEGRIPAGRELLNSDSYFAPKNSATNA